jgi:hypothetical protein
MSVVEFIGRVHSSHSGTMLIRSGPAEMTETKKRTNRKLPNSHTLIVLIILPPVVSMTIPYLQFFMRAQYQLRLPDCTRLTLVMAL